MNCPHHSDIPLSEFTHRRDTNSHTCSSTGLKTAKTERPKSCYLHIVEQYVATVTSKIWLEWIPRSAKVRHFGAHSMQFHIYNTQAGEALLVASEPQQNFPRQEGVTAGVHKALFESGFASWHNYWLSRVVCCRFPDFSYWLKKNGHNLLGGAGG